jgi:hypothetical protein
MGKNKQFPLTMGVVTVVLLVWTLTKVANNTKVSDNPGRAFWLENVHVVQCSADEITLIDKRGTETHLMKDESWPDCTVFHKEQAIDLQLSRGDKTRFVKKQPTAWWR